MMKLNRYFQLRRYGLVKNVIEFNKNSKGNQDGEVWHMKYLMGNYP